METKKGLQNGKFLALQQKTISDKGKYLHAWMTLMLRLIHSLNIFIKHYLKTGKNALKKYTNI